MTKILIDEAPAGPAMDAAVAKALGYIVLDHDFVSKDGENWEPCKLDYLLGYKDDEERVIPEYSIDIAAAWEVFEQLKHMAAILGWSREWLVPYVTLPIPELITEENLGRYGTVYANSAPLAICRAFLKANGVEHIEIKDENTS